MGDEDFAQARRALVSENWDDAERQYYYLQSKDKLEAGIALAFINLHKAREKLSRKENGAREALEIAAGKLNDLLDGAEPLHTDFILAFAPKVLANLAPRHGPNHMFPSLSLPKGICVKQWLTATITRNLLLNFSFTDDVTSLPETVQRAICQAIVDLDQYVDNLVLGRIYETPMNTPSAKYRGGLDSVIKTNRKADPASYKRCEELRTDPDVKEKMKHVYRALGIADAYVLPITPEEIERAKRILIKKTIVWIIIACVVAIVLSLLIAPY
ncbi:MAG: hypothetical protein K6G50_04390 [bacterium]|nr:hypothetical protein [bacterium]